MKAPAATPPAANGGEPPSLATIFAPVRSQTAFEETLERLGTAIKLGLLEPGSQLPAERELCGRLGIARSTLRQALTALVQSGHLRAVRGRGGGTFVAESPPRAADPSAELLAGWRDACDARLAVELGVAVLACDRATPADLEPLHELIEAMDARIEDFPAYRQDDVRFHIGLAAGDRECAAGGLRDRGPGRDDRPDLLHRAPARGARVVQRPARPAAACRSARATPPARSRRWSTTSPAPSTCSPACFPPPTVVGGRAPGRDPKEAAPRAGYPPAVGRGATAPGATAGPVPPTSTSRIGPVKRLRASTTHQTPVISSTRITVAGA